MAQNTWLADHENWLFLSGLALGAFLVTSLLFLRWWHRRPDVRTSQEAAFQQHAFHALLSISEAIDEEPTVTQVFEQALNAVREATGFDSVAMRIYERDHGCFRLVVHRGMSPAMVRELACIRADRGFQAEVVRTKQPAVSSNLATDPRLGGASPLEMGYRSLACVPLLANGELMGTMELASSEAYNWTAEQISWLSLVGRSVGVFLRHVQYASHLRNQAVVKERSLIAQEIHDGLAQLIGSVYVWAEDAQLSLAEGEVEHTTHALQKIDQAARDAYATLREEMFGLRNMPLPGQSLIPYLSEILERFQRQWGIAVHLSVSGATNGHKVPVTISPAAEIQLLRILQEVLTNVRRHACASTVRLKLAEKDEWLIVDVEDDGRGFDPQQISDEHLGLSIIRERTASVGGRLTLEAEPGQGTRVRIELPPRSRT